MDSPEYSISFSTASVDITPGFPVPLAGYAGRTKEFAAMEEPLSAVAIRFIDNAACPLLISLDLLYPSNTLREEILTTFAQQIEAKDLFLCATHTHYAPAIDRTKPRLGQVDDQYEKYVRERVVALVREVLEKEPTVGTLHYGEQFARHAVNRRLMLQRPVVEKRKLVKGGLRFAPNFVGPKDEKVRVVSVLDESGSPAAILWNYACHPVGDPHSVLLGAEYPGTVRRFLKSQYKKQPEVLFFQGFCGDIRPYFFDRKKKLGEVARELGKGPSFIPMTERERQEWRRTLSECVVDAMTMSVNSPPLQSSIYTERRAYPLSAMLESAPSDRFFSISRLDFGNRLRFLFLSAEPVTAFSDFLKRISLGRFTLPIGYMDDVFGYIPTNMMTSEGGYESEQFFEHFSLSGGFKPKIENFVKKSITDIIKSGQRPDIRPQYTVPDIENGLRSLGLKEGDLVLARCGLLALGNVEGGSTDTFVTALLNVIGPSGTLVGLAFNNCLSLPWEKKKECITSETAPYTGAFVKKLLNIEGAVRSRHPSNSFVAIGPKADELLSFHDERAASFAPMEKFIELNGKMILVGCIDASPGFSTTHWAQERLGLSYKNIFAPLESAEFLSNGEVKTFRRKDIPGCSKGFYKFFSHYIHRGELTIAYVGDALSYAIDSQPAFEIDYNILKTDPTFALCEDPNCRHCRGSLLYNLSDMPKYYLNKIFKKTTSIVRKKAM